MSVTPADLLLSRGKLSAVDLSRAMRLQQEDGGTLDEILLKLGFVSDRDLAEAHAEIDKLPVVRSEAFPQEPLFENLLSADFLINAKALPIREEGTGVLVAMADPSDTFTAEAIASAIGRPVHKAVAPATELEAALQRLYGNAASSMAQIVQELGEEEGGEGEDIARLRDLASEAPVIRLVSLLLSRAAELRASDIHIEPFEKSLKVRYRIDGILEEVESPPQQLAAAVISRIKIMANLNIAERRLPQDGRIKVRIAGKEIDLRVSTLPTLHGESVVLRLLDKGGVTLDFDALGFSGHDLDMLLPALERPHGIVLVTGPTGSGKTTTLYTALSHLNTPDKKILTVEDPVEYVLEGINQIQTKSQIGLTFARALRSILRQDPDIIMIGEIRDLETAQIAVQAALTGHLVLSTLHTNNAVQTLTRLVDMGVEDYLLTATINAIMAQRLVRRLCRHCVHREPVPEELFERLQLQRFGAQDHTLPRPGGCPMCGNGYHGRLCLTEIVPMTEELGRLLLRRAGTAELSEAARHAGMRGMFDDGLEKVVGGLTTLDEVVRVTQDS
jgi:general secretion pathway protein E